MKRKDNNNWKIFKKILKKMYPNMTKKEILEQLKLDDEKYTPKYE